VTNGRARIQQQRLAMRKNFKNKKKVEKHMITDYHQRVFKLLVLHFKDLNLLHAIKIEEELEVRAG
jgi:hypothetical protein